VRAAVKLLTDQGFRVERFRPDGLEEARKLWEIFFVQCGAMFYASTVAGKTEQLSPTFKDFLRIAQEQSPLNAASLLQAWADADLMRSRIFAQMADFPILLLPVCSIPAFVHGERKWTIDGVPLDYLDAMRFTQWFNLLGAPAAVVPVSWSEPGLPIGVQIAGRMYDDELVLTVAKTIDQAFGYRMPPMALLD
jgi:amidase